MRSYRDFLARQPSPPHNTLTNLRQNAAGRETVRYLRQTSSKHLQQQFTKMAATKTRPTAGTVSFTAMYKSAFVCREDTTPANARWNGIMAFRRASASRQHNSCIFEAMGSRMTPATTTWRLTINLVVENPMPTQPWLPLSVSCDSSRHQPDSKLDQGTQPHLIHTSKKMSSASTNQRPMATQDSSEQPAGTAKDAAVEKVGRSGCRLAPRSTGVAEIL